MKNPSSRAISKTAPKEPPSVVDVVVVGRQVKRYTIVMCVLFMIHEIEIEFRRQSGDCEHQRLSIPPPPSYGNKRATKRGLLHGRFHEDRRVCEAAADASHNRRARVSVNYHQTWWSLIVFSCNNTCAADAAAAAARRAPTLSPSRPSRPAHTHKKKTETDKKREEKKNL